MPQLTIARFDNEDYEAFNDFIQACGNYLEDGKPYGGYAYQNWRDLDKDDPERIVIEKLREEIAEDDNMHPDDVDDRVLMYMYISKKWDQQLGAHNRVMWAAHVLRDTFTDPTEDHLCWADGLIMQHVANEQ